MAVSSSIRRSSGSFLIALVIYGIIIAWVLNRWHWPEVVEPLKDVTPMMRLMTTAQQAKQKSEALPELAASAPAQTKSIVSITPAPAAPRKALSERKAHKAVVAKPKPSVPASTAEQVVAPVPTAPQASANPTQAADNSIQPASTIEPTLQTPALSASALKDIAGAYRSMVHGRIAALQQYPVLARRMGEEGTVLVRFTILASGKISNVSIIESSGSESLDVAAVAIFMEGLNGQLPPIPVELNKNEWTLSLPIRYQLQ